MVFTGHVELKSRLSYPALEELPEYLKRVCLQFHAPYVGIFEAAKNDNKLLTSDNHLNNFVLCVRYRTPGHIKDIAFTMGITDFDENKGCRVPGNAHAYIQSKEDRFTTGKQIAEAALDLWESRIPPKPKRSCPVVDIPPKPNRTCTVVGCVPGCTIEDFDGAKYGEKYLSFKEGEAILMLTHLQEGWAYGFLKGHQGWFPPSFVNTCLLATSER